MATRSRVCAWVDRHGDDFRTAQYRGARSGRLREQRLLVGCGELFRHWEVRGCAGAVAAGSAAEERERRLSE